MNPVARLIIRALARPLGRLLRCARAARTRQRFGWLVLLTLSLMAALWMMTHAASPWIRMGLNATESLPGWVYLVVKDQRPTSRTDPIAFWPPANPAYPRSLWFIKIARGLPGDHITRRRRAFFVEGAFVGRAKPQARSGRVLAPGPEGVLPAGQYFVWTPHPESYDSRYADIGWIPEARLIGRAYRLL
jgi:conjugal transfer pilin signal peptidase TrbI